MALSAAGLAALVKSELVANGITGAGGADDLDDLCDSLGAAIVEHVVNNLSVQIPVGAVLVAATAGVPNPSPISCTVA
jgi:hypothetical protein